MMANMRIESEINRIVDKVTGQDAIRRNAVDRLLLGVVYGQFPHELFQMIEEELHERTGDGNVISFFSLAGEKSPVKELLKEALNDCREKMENGFLDKKAFFYIPVIFMADQLDAQEAAGVMKELKEGLKGQGYDKNFELGYYVFFNYTEMDCNRCKKEVESFIGDDGFEGHLYLFTHDFTAGSVFFKYLKAVRALALHVYLKVCRQGIRRRAGKCSVIGYWKYDVLKQKIADYLLRLAESQSRGEDGYNFYYSRMCRRMEELAGIEKEKLLRQFCGMPVDYGAVEKKFSWKNLLLLGKNKIKCRTLIQELYGSVNAFEEFVRRQVRPVDDLLKDFWKSDAGNIYEVENYLLTAMRQLGKELDERICELQQNETSLDSDFFFGIKCELGEVVSRIKTMFWEKEILVIECRREKELAEAVMGHLAAGESKNNIEKAKRRNEEQIKALHGIRQEAVLAGSHIADNLHLKIEENIKVNWNEDIFDDKIMQLIERNIEDIRKQILSWMQKGIGDVLGDFVSGLANIKRNGMADYFAAKLVQADNLEDWEYLFIAEQKQPEEKDAIDRIVHNFLPGAEVMEQSWQTDMCYEVFVQRDINDISVIYGWGGGND